MVAQQDYTWEQGEDLVIEVIYQVNGEPVEMTVDSHAVRMDIAPAPGGSAGEPVFSFNSEDFDGTLDTEGPDDNEAAFATGGVIHIKVPRSLTLPGGAVATAMDNTKDFMYDLFLRDKGQDTQKKLLTGKISVRPSITHWA